MRYQPLLWTLGCPAMRNHLEVTLQLGKMTASGLEGLWVKRSVRMNWIGILTKHPASSALHRNRVDLPFRVLKLTSGDGMVVHEQYYIFFYVDSFYIPVS